MRTLLAAVAAAAVAVTTPAVTTPAVAGAPRCDRACVIAVADTYLQALVSHDGSKVALAKDVQRVENGANSGNGEEELRSGLSSPIMFVITGIRELEWDVAGNVAVATYVMDTVTSPTYIVERFQLSGRLIKRIDANFYIDAPGYVAGPEAVATNPGAQGERFTAWNHGPAGPVPMAGNAGDTKPHAKAAGCDSGCAGKALRDLVAAMSSHRAGAVRLDASAQLIVNRRPVATGAGAVRAALQASTVKAVKGLKATADGTTVAAVYDAVLARGTSHAAVRITLRGKAIQKIYLVCDDAETCLT